MKEGDCIEPLVLMALQIKSASPLLQSKEDGMAHTNRNMIVSSESDLIANRNPIVIRLLDLL